MARVLLASAALEPAAPPPSPSAYPIAIPAGALHFVTDIVHEGRNDNGHIFLPDELRRAWETFRGTPIDDDHEFKIPAIVGGIYDAALVQRDNRLTLRVAGFIHARLHPQEAWLVESRIVTGISMECIFERADRVKDGRILRNIRFIGAGLTRMPADPDCHIDRVGDQQLRAAAALDARRRALLTGVVIEAWEAAA